MNVEKGSQQFTFSLLKNLAEGIIIVDREGCIQFCNPSAVQMFGYAKDEVLGCPIEFLIPGICKRLPLGGRHEHVPECPPSSHLVLAGRSKAGEELCLQVSAIPLTYKGCIYILLSILDITERERAAEIRRANERYVSLINGMSDAVCVVDLHGRVQFINKAYLEMFDCREEQVVGQLPNFGEELQKEIEQLIRRAWDGESVVDFQITRASHGGKPLHLNVSLYPICDSDCGVTGFSLIIRDITAHIKAEEMLRHSEKLSAIGQIAAGIAHEIRNPLTSLMGFVALLEMGVGDSKRYLKIISDELNRINSIINEMLLMAKPHDYQLGMQDLRMLLQSVITLLEPQANFTNIHIRQEFEPVPLILGDEYQLKQAFINILRNSMEAMPHGGEILVQLSRYSENQISICFVDQGVGIPEELLGQIGTPFFTTKEGGTGLGVMITQKVVADHGGSMRISSKPNCGTTVEVILPIGHQQQSG